MVQLESLPSRISYTTNLIISPQRERRALIPRRALFDVRMQIMAEAEDDDDDSNEAGTTNGQDARNKANAVLETLGLGDADISQNVYEGGFKSWEGAMDLARLLLERGPRKDIDDLERCDGVVEVSARVGISRQHTLTLRSSVAAPASRH
jgi:protein-histidine N-methyltransferase